MGNFGILSRWLRSNDSSTQEVIYDVRSSRLERRGSGAESGVRGTFREAARDLVAARAQGRQRVDVELSNVNVDSYVL